jgi:large subunit ribosomal protein L34e
MVQRSKRTRSVKKVKVRTPGGRTTTHFRSGSIGAVRCGMCDNPLPGVATGTPTQLKGMSASSKTPNRPYAGVLCSDCLDGLIRYVTRMEVKYSGPEYALIPIERDLTIEKFLPRGWFASVQEGKKKVIREKVKPKKEGKPKKAKEEKAEDTHKKKAKTKAKK